VAELESLPASEGESEPTRRKDRDEGNWGLLKDFFFEDTEDAGDPIAQTGGIPAVSIKKTLLNIFFEEVPDAAVQPSQQTPASPGQSGTTSQPASSENTEPQVKAPAT